MTVEATWRRRNAVAGIVLATLFAVSTMVWVMLDRAPPNWDDAWYLTNSLTVYDALAQDGVAGYLSKLNSVFGFKAPLIAGLPAPLYLLFGRHWHAAYLVNIAAMLVLFAAIYRIAGRWWSSRAAVFAVAVTGTMPLLYGLGRWYMVEYAMASLLTAAVCLLIESNGLNRAGHRVALGILCGIGCLLKVTFPVFFLPCFLYVWIRSGRRTRPLLLTALPCLLVAMPWYAAHFRPILAFAFDASFGTTGALYGTGSILSMRTMVAYLSLVVTNGVSTYFTLLALVLSPLVLVRLRKRRSRPVTAEKTWPLLAAWFLPFAIFALGANKDVRLMAPILPAAALVCAFLLDCALPHGRLGTAAGTLLLAFPMLQMFSISFGIPYTAKGAGYARRFSNVPWPHDEIVKFLAADSSLRYGERELLLVGADRGAFNANNIELSVVALRLPFDVETTAHEKNFDSLRHRLMQASFYLYEEGGEPESRVFNPYAGDLARLVADESRFRELPYARHMPDGGTARLFKNLTAGRRDVAAAMMTSEATIPEEFAVDFGGILALTGMSVIATPEETTVKFRWRCRKPADRDYICFTHLINSDNRIVAQLDHPLLGGNPPLRAWRVGDGGEEVVRLRLPAGVPRAALRLRFGLYYPPSGERLSIRPLQQPAASRFSLADQATALLTPN